MKELALFLNQPNHHLKKSEHLEMLVLSLTKLFEHLVFKDFFWAPIIIIFDLPWSSGYRLLLGTYLVYKVKIIIKKIG
jgi:hypothetical protein